MKINQLDKRQKAKDVIKAAKAGQQVEKIPNDPEYLKAAALALVYEEQLGTYYNNSAQGYLIGGVLMHWDINYEHFVKASILADKLEVSYDFYIKAQFYWLNKWFNTAPKPYQLSSDKGKHSARARVKLYKQELAKGVKESKVYGPERSQPIVTTNQKHLMSDDQLNRLMKNYNASEEDIYRVFCSNGQEKLFFDKDWLNSRPIYQKLKEAGEI